MSFDRAELEKMQLKGLLRLADYLGIRYNQDTEKSKIIDSIMAELNKRGNIYRDFGIDSIQSVPEVPRYSVRVKRIMDSKREKGEM